MIFLEAVMIAVCLAVVGTGPVFGMTDDLSQVHNIANADREAYWGTATHFVLTC